MLVAVVMIAGIVMSVHAPALLSCQFHSITGPWEGSCGRLFGQDPTLTIARARSITTGRWREDVEPTAVWAGEITDSGGSNTPLELEIYQGGSGVLRTEYGWIPISGFTAAATTLRFQLDTSREVPPSNLDRQIVRRAEAILSSTSVWNRADNRHCAAAATTWSIYCAMERATIEVTGAFHHRRPALQVVRQVVDERTAGRRYDHRLMDYNNDPSTRLADVRSLFAEALARMSRQSR
jgi:hypothetical protein